MEKRSRKDPWAQIALGFFLFPISIALLSCAVEVWSDYRGDVNRIGTRSLRHQQMLIMVSALDRGDIGPEERAQHEQLENLLRELPLTPAPVAYLDGLTDQLSDLRTELVLKDIRWEEREFYESVWLDVEVEWPPGSAMAVLERLDSQDRFVLWLSDAPLDRDPVPFSTGIRLEFEILSLRRSLEKPRFADDYLECEPVELETELWPLTARLEAASDAEQARCAEVQARGSEARRLLEFRRERVLIQDLEDVLAALSEADYPILEIVVARIDAQLAAH